MSRYIEIAHCFFPDVSVIAHQTPELDLTNIILLPKPSDPPREKLRRSGRAFGLTSTLTVLVPPI